MKAAVQVYLDGDKEDDSMNDAFNMIGFTDGRHLKAGSTITLEAFAGQIMLFDFKKAFDQTLIS